VAAYCIALLNRFDSAERTTLLVLFFNMAADPSALASAMAGTTLTSKAPAPEEAGLGKYDDVAGYGLGTELVSLLLPVPQHA
jgi:hypothetical protein